MTPEPVSTAELAPAKINLALHITGRQTDGYHLIDSLVVFTRFGDRIETSTSAEDSFDVSGRYAAAVPRDGDNLMLKARDVLRAHCGGIGKAPPVAITLEKNLPVASGIGGGSSDAAATLRSLAKLWQLDMDEAGLARLGAPLGADVPMCLAARPLIARGIGDTLSVLSDFPSLGLVLVNPGTGVATAKVFAALANAENSSLPPVPGHVEFHSLRNWLGVTRNDLETAAQAIEPSINAALSSLKKADAGFARMSGSGATCFGLYETGNVAKRAAATIRRRHPDWFVAATRSIASADA